MAHAPPSYLEATGQPTSVYLASRPLLPPTTSQTTQPAQAEAEQLIYILNSDSILVETAPFPSPATTWLARDVDRDDWVALNEELLPLLSDNPAEVSDKREHQARVIAEWNRFFFDARGCRIELADVDVDTNTNSQQAALQTGGVDAVRAVPAPVAAPASAAGGPDVNGLGFRVGGSFIGIGVGAKNNGFGIKLGDMIIGVSTPSQKK